MGCVKAHFGAAAYSKQTGPASKREGEHMLACMQTAAISMHRHAPTWRIKLCMLARPDAYVCIQATTATATVVCIPTHLARG